jgi:hypothetical protein
MLRSLNVFIVVEINLLLSVEYSIDGQVLFIKKLFLNLFELYL